jgi:hypothetical protein
MAGRGPAPSPPSQRRRRNEPARGEWHALPGIGWQHGEIPRPPARLRKASREAWDVWLRAWYAAHWRPEDLPALRQVIRLYDQLERGDFRKASELRQLEDTWGISPKGQQERRWAPPWNQPGVPAEPEPEAPKKAAPSRYGHLRSVG